MEMNFKEMGMKAYLELTDDEIKGFEKALIDYNLNLEQRNTIFISLLFGDIIKKAVSRI